LVLLSWFTNIADRCNTSLFANCPWHEGMHTSAAKKELIVRNGFLISLVALAFAATFARAQGDQPPTKQLDDSTKAPVKSPAQVEVTPQKDTKDTLEAIPMPAVVPGTPSPIDLDHSSVMDGYASPFCDTPECSGNKCWASLEYLLWWIKDGPTPPLVTTSKNPAADQPFSGALGEPNTVILFGQSNLDYGTFSGGRLTVGGWLAPGIGIEANAFLLEQRSVRFSASSDATGNPPLYIPAFYSNINHEDRLIVSEPFNANQTTGGFTGSVGITSTTRLWGTELNAVLGGWSSSCWEGSFLAGFRYIDLQESLDLSNTTVTLPLTGQTGAFVSSVADSFETRNQFYGGQIGGKFSYHWNFLTFEFVGKIALGDSHQVVNILGVSSQSGPNSPTPGSFVGGLFAQPTNIGRQTQNEFTVVPEGIFKVDCTLCCGLHAFIGYDIMYWNQVVRPGAEINRDLNVTQSAVISGNPNPVLVGPAQPTPLFNRTEFYANGLTFGIELKY
jgi:Putative beta barrel porin-7 (BBP7)